jgi:hypothetical protein
MLNVEVAWQQQLANMREQERASEKYIYAVIWE